MSWNPTDVKLLTEGLPGCGGVMKTEPDTFAVEEIPLYEPVGEGEHVYVWVEKRDVPANRLMDEVARKAGVDRRAVGAAGLKDRRAVTRQWLSIHHHDLEPESMLGPICDGVEVLRATRHRNKLKTGHLIGNRFSIELRDLAVSSEKAVVRAEAIMEVLTEHGVPNYFGAQRFGHELSTLELGLALLRGERPAQTRKNRWLRKLAASAAQSALFNFVLRERLEAGTEKMALLGDRLNRLTERGQLLVTAENQAEAQALVDDGMLIPTGPMFGAKMYDVTDDALRLEEAALSEFSLNREQFDKISKIAPGTRRDLLISFLEPPTVAAGDDQSLRISFSLPSGAYATIVLAELTKLDSSAWEAP